MAAIFTLSDRADGAITTPSVRSSCRATARFVLRSLRSGGTITCSNSKHSLRSGGTTAHRFNNPTQPVAGSGRLIGQLETPHYAVTRCVPMERPLVTLRNPARHGVTPMAPQDFPLCAAFQEE